MSAATIDARTLTLTRLERAAGQSFGCEQDISSVSGISLVSPTTLALAAFATAVAATLSYLI